MAVYFDSSSLVKLAIEEPESPAMRRYVTEHSRQFSAALAHTEVLRAVRRHGVDRLPRAYEALNSIARIDVTPELLEEAAAIDPPEVRTLDAIHLAAALTLGDELEAVVTYDTRITEAALAAGVRVDAPS